ncbi:hypothetical protein N9Z14_08205 [Opitutales bacterium]|nr:hypothetical protein [Opitutales bacterium]
MKRPSDSTLKIVSIISYAVGLLLWVTLVILAVSWFNDRTIDGKEIEPITVILGLIMPLFFAIPSAIKRITTPKPIQLMSHDEILNLIKRTNRKEWKRIDEDEVEGVFYLQDPKLRIKHYSGEKGICNPEFIDDWANKFPDPQAASLYYEIQYSSEVIERVILVGVDGYRAYLPIPERETMIISELDHAVAMLIAYRYEDYHHYVKSAGFRMEDPNQSAYDNDITAAPSYRA